MHRLPRSRPRTLRFETLEARRVMTSGVTAALNSAGVLNILGTDADEQVLFHETGSAISITGVSGSWLASRVKAINVDLKGGNDVVSLASKINGGNQALAKNFSILSGGGNDRVLLANGRALNFNGPGSKLTVTTKGNAAVDGVALNWSSQVLVSLSSAGVLKVTGTNAADNLLFRQTNGKISLSGVTGSWTATKVKSIVVYLQDGNDTVSLNSLADGGTQALQKAVTVYSGAGDDRVELADGHDALFSELGNTLLVSAAGTATLDGQVLNWSPAVSIPDLTAASDSGVSNTDNLTSVTTPTFSWHQCGRHDGPIAGRYDGVGQHHGGWFRQLVDYRQCTSGWRASDRGLGQRSGRESKHFWHLNDHDRHARAARIHTRSRRGERQR